MKKQKKRVCNIVVSGKERAENDFYATDPFAAKLLLNVEKFDVNIWECASGKNHLADVFKEYGYSVRTSDLVKRTPTTEVKDFLLVKRKWCGDIITNPPFKLAQQFTEKALSLITEGHKLALFLPVSYLDGKKRYNNVFAVNPPKTVYVPSLRIRCYKDGETISAKSGGMTTYAWFVWEKGFNGETTIKWINHGEELDEERMRAPKEETVEETKNETPRAEIIDLWNSNETDAACIVRSLCSTNVYKHQSRGNKLTIGTVFSGIGSPEQALIRLGIQYKIAFACDNGERTIDIDYDQELAHVRRLGTIEQKRIYVENLYKTHTRKKNFVQQSYLANYQVENGNFFQDVKLLDGTDFKGKIDLLVGGSPCQSFSIAGGKRGLDDARGTLFFDYCRLIKEIQPKVFIYENVFGVINHNNGSTWEIMQNSFRELGYHFCWKVLNAKDYGVPQSRKRLFVIGFKDSESFEKFNFPKTMKLKYFMQDFQEENLAEGGLMSIGGQLRRVTNCKGEPGEEYYLSEKTLRYVLSPGTKGFVRRIETDRSIASAVVKNVYNNYRAGISNYVTTHGRLRQLTVRELHRLMGFPDDYKIVVSKSQAGKQAGNSIVVDVVMAVIREVLNALQCRHSSCIVINTPTTYNFIAINRLQSTDRSTPIVHMPTVNWNVGMYEMPQCTARGTPLLLVTLGVSILV